jgi:hypothetical protein
MADIRINSLPSTATSFNTDDYIAIDGASAGTRKMLAATLPLTDVTFGTSGPSAKSSIAARAARQGLVFDGASQTNTVAISAIGTNNCTYAAWINTSALGAIQQIIGSYATGAGSSGLTLQITTAGKLQASAPYQGDNTASTGGITAGKWTFVVYVRSATNQGTYYINGVADSSITESFNNYVGTNVRIGGGTGSNYFNGSISGALIYNRALSAAEVVSLYEAGVPSGSDYNTASNTNLATTTVVASGGTLSGESATGFTMTSASGVAYVGTRPAFGATTTGLAGVAPVGSRWLVTFTATLTSGAAPSLSILQTNSFASISNTATVTAGSNSVVLTTTANGTWVVCPTFYTTSASTYTISAITVTRLGLLLAPDAAQAGGGLTWYDTSGNAANITLPASGVSWNVPSSRVLGGNWTTSGNLTVSGSGPHSFSGRISVTNASGAYAGSFINTDATTAPGLYVQASRTTDSALLVRNASDSSDLLRVTNSGGTVIGGNLTVSGAGTSTIGGDLTVTGTGGGASSIGRVGLNGVGPAGVLSITSDAKTAADAIGLTFLGKDSANNAQTYAAIRALIEDPTSTSEDGALQLLTVSAGTLAEKARLTSTGNYLLGTAGVDSGNGKLQVGTNTTTAAGGIGFGTDISLYRSGANTLFTNASTFTLPSTGDLRWDGGGYVTIGASSSLVFRNLSAATILTLEGSSQNATFAGAVEVSKSAASTNLNALTLRNSAYNVGESTSIVLTHGTGSGKPVTSISSYLPGSNQSELVFYTSNTSAVSTEALRINGSQNATFAGTVITPAATTAISSVRLPHGTAPTSPVNGDMWTTTAGLYVRINGVTVGPLS